MHPSPASVCKSATLKMLRVYTNVWESECAVVVVLFVMKETNCASSNLMTQCDKWSYIEFLCGLAKQALKGKLEFISWCRLLNCGSVIFLILHCTLYCWLTDQSLMLEIRAEESTEGVSRRT